MHILLGFILIVSGLLVVTYFSDSKSQIEKLPTLEYKTEASTNISSSGTASKKEEVSGRIRVKNLQTGETGTIEEWDFDPKKFQRLDSSAKASNYDYEKAKVAGLSDEEILNYIVTKSPNGTVTIRNKATGEIQKIPKSQLANYISSTKPELKVVKASDKALKQSIYAFLASNEKQRNDLINKFSNGTNDLKEAIKNIALLLDSNPEAMALIEKTIAQDIASKKLQEENDAIVEYHRKEYERIKAEYDSIPKNTSNTYIGTQNTNVKPSLPQERVTQNNTYAGFTESQNTSLRTNLQQRTTDIYTHPTPEPINVYGDADSYTRIGNTTFGSDGSYYTQLGNTVFGNDGSDYTRFGNSIFGNDGSYSYKLGNTTFTNDGRDYTQFGNSIFGSDGSSYYKLGNTVFRQPGY